jgi:DNA-cytosine methyltransferase
MNILSLFDGMACGRIALERAGVPVTNYFASEIDKYSMTVAKANYPDIKHIGAAQDVRATDLPPIDLVMGGSPCQGFSFAGKQLAFDDPRSKLFFEFVRVLKEVKPKYFLLENVRMKKEYLAVISEQLGVEPVLVNSALVSAQNRQRYYWCNWAFKQPEDKRVHLCDVIEQGVVDRDKSLCLLAGYEHKFEINRYINKSIHQAVLVLQVPRGNNPGGVRALDGKTPCMSAHSWEHNNHLVTALTEQRTEEAKRIRKECMQLYGKDFSPRRAKELVPRTDGKMNCLTAAYSTKEHTLIDETLHYRKLTPIECERLQTVPDDYTNHVSNAQRYKMLGNGWTVDVIAHIFKVMPLQKGDGA